MKKVFLITVGLLLLTAGLALAADDIAIKPFGTIFAHYEYNISGYEDYDSRFADNDMNKFELMRVYLGLDAKLSKSWSANITIDTGRKDVTKLETEKTTVPTGVEDDPATDVDESQTEVLTSASLASTKTGQYEYFVKYAYMTYQPFDYLGVDFGMIKTPYADKAYNLWRHRYLLDSAFTHYSFIRSSTADLGGSIHGTIPGNYASYYVALMNGEGYKNAEANAGKALGAMIYLSPFQMIDPLKGLVLMGTYHYDKIMPDYPEELATSFDTILSYKYDLDKDGSMGFSVNGEYASRTVTTGDEVAQPLLAGLEDKSVTSTVISVWADFWFMSKYGFLARYDMMDPNTKNESKDPATDQDWDAAEHKLTYEKFFNLNTNVSGYQDEQTFLLVGFWYQPIKPVRLCLNYRQVGYTAEILDKTQEDIDAGKSAKAVTKQADQYVYLNTEVKF